MPDEPPLYPPNPTNVPPGLTRPTAAYRYRVLVVLASLFAFLIVYLGLTVGSAYLSYWCFATLARGSTAPPKTITFLDSRGRPVTRTVQQGDRPAPIVFIPLGLGSGLLCLFLVKGLFKRNRNTAGVRFEVTAAEQPELFEFIRRLCRDTRAPFPHRVYLVPDVTASVSFEESLLNLILPMKKNLNIGLGLVNGLNLTEFKAVLAHEFGHFSQNGMRLGSYVYTANRAIVDVVYGRDWLDDLVAAATRIDIRLSIFVWAFAGILWVIRKGLHFLFQGINFARVSLSRHMEYNADRVAVSVTGSDPLIFALARLDFATESLGHAWEDLKAAADHGRFTRDLYYHQTKAAQFLRAKRGDPSLGQVPPLPDDRRETVRVFRPEDTSVPAMWATHPSNADREAHAKEHYFRGPTDDRPAWRLFANVEGVRKRMTYEAYKATRDLPVPELEEPEAVQAFIDAEHVETTYPPQYHGLYENRYVSPGELADLILPSHRADFADRERLADAHARLSGDHLRERMADHRRRQEELGRLTGIARGHVELTGATFEHRGKKYPKERAAKLLATVEKEIEADFRWMHEHDRAAFLVHYAMACQLGDGPRRELEERYRFHFRLQQLHRTVVGLTSHAQATMAALQGARQVPEEDFLHAVAVLRDARQLLKEQLEDVAYRLPVPALTNMPAGSMLGPYLFTGRLLKPLPADTTTLNGKWVGELFTQATEVSDKAARILFKSLGVILTLQDQIAADWHARRDDPAPPPPPPPATRPDDDGLPTYHFKDETT